KALWGFRRAASVGLNMGGGRGGAWTHARLCGEVDHAVEPVLPERALYGFLIDEIGANEIPGCLCSSRRLRQQFEPPLLQFGAVVGVDIIKTKNRVAALKKAFCRMEADKARRTSDEDFHVKDARRSPACRTPP